MYLVPVVVEDGGYPIRSSTGMVTVRVCTCDTDGSLLSCNAEAVFFPMGLSTGALMAITLCIVILLVMVVLYMGLRKHKKDTLMSSKEDIRDNVIHYDDEGGGEEDTQAFDIGTLRNPKGIKETAQLQKIKSVDEPNRASACMSNEDSEDIRAYIHHCLLENSAPPYDSLVTYAYEGEGSVAESLSSIESWVLEPKEDYRNLCDWGPRFKTLAGIFKEHEYKDMEKMGN
ncbi:cadherin-12-like [Carassius auratus]|uniref:Cadherin-12-like n=1 Tax=Carassius auratus TaxID=7957 RepID=A0A6P6MME9_CARAU|nr:cadherin-12-like [Carassius auratus]